MPIEAVVEGVTEEVAENLEEIAEATRQINATAVGYFTGGIFIGLGVGFFLGYRFNKEKIKAEAFKNSEEEISKLREVYEQRALVAKEKPSVQEIVEERGYSTKVEEPPRPLPAPVPVQVFVNPAKVNEPPTVSYEAKQRTGSGSEWDYAAELAQRSAEQPYIVHQDEFKQADNGYHQVTYTYYDADSVLCDENDRPLPHPDLVVGEENLKFGHGSDDEDVVFVRNDRLELQMEICRSPASYEEDVLGVDRDEAN
jgi:hypothetical protein